MTNLFAFRATNPADLHTLIRSGYLGMAIGEDNDTAIANAANTADLVAVAWGANADRYRDRVEAVLGNFLRPSCISTTKDGHPLHPLMARYTDAPRIYEAPES